MWIEYDLHCIDEDKCEIHERGLFNSDHIKWVQIERHGGGYGEAIEMYYDGYDSKCVFMVDNKEIMDRVLHALKHALAGVPCTVAGIGYIRPLQRPFNEETTLIPSAYQGAE